MIENMHLYVALALVLLSSGAVTYNHIQRDWVGLRLLGPPMFIGSLPSLLIMVLLYEEIVDVANLAFLARYRLLISLIAAGFAEYGKKLLVGRTKYDDVLVRKVIAKEKSRIADTLERDPNCTRVLEDAIETADVSNAVKRPLRKKLKEPPVRRRIYDVIAAVGTAHVRSMMPTKK